jgi:hypothetical protein
MSVLDSTLERYDRFTHVKAVERYSAVYRPSGPFSTHSNFVGLFVLDLQDRFAVFMIKVGY